MLDLFAPSTENQSHHVLFFQSQVSPHLLFLPYLLLFTAAFLLLISLISRLFCYSGDSSVSVALLSNKGSARPCGGQVTHFLDCPSDFHSIPELVITNRVLQ